MKEASILGLVIMSTTTPGVLLIRSLGPAISGSGMVTNLHSWNQQFSHRHDDGWHRIHIKRKHRDGNGHFAKWGGDQTSVWWRKWDWNVHRHERKRDYSNSSGQFF